MKYVTYYPSIESFRRAPNVGFWNYACAVVLVTAILTLIFA